MTAKEFVITEYSEAREKWIPENDAEPERWKIINAGDSDLRSFDTKEEAWDFALGRLEKKFNADTAWIEDGTGTLKRNQMKRVPGATFEIIANNDKDGTFQVKVEDEEIPVVHKSPFPSLLDAKQFAWEHYKKFLKRIDSIKKDTPNAEMT